MDILDKYRAVPANRDLGGLADRDPETGISGDWASGVPGDWALVTGAAGGIGFAFADRLGALGYNLVLADIDGEGLSAAAADLAMHYGVDGGSSADQSMRHGIVVRTFAIDLSASDAARRLHDWCGEQNIVPRIVVNNAGIFSYNDITATDPARIETMIGLHVVTVSQICRLFGADMVWRAEHLGREANDRRKFGYILNMSSYSAWMPWPGIATYSASKAYIRNFSLALAAELRERGVSVTTVLPAGVTTGLYGLVPRLQTLGRRLGLLMTPERVAGLALRAMFRGRRHYVPGFFMRLVLPLVRTLPARAIRLARHKTLKFQK